MGGQFAIESTLYTVKYCMQYYVYAVLYATPKIPPLGLFAGARFVAIINAFSVHELPDYTTQHYTTLHYTTLHYGLTGGPVPSQRYSVFKGCISIRLYSRVGLENSLRAQSCASTLF